MTIHKLAMALVGGTLVGCAPTFSDLQSARLAGVDRVEITPSYSSISLADEGEVNKIQDHFGLQLATGVHEAVDVRIRYEFISIGNGDGESAQVHVLGGGPKVSLARDRAAIFLPVGFAFGSDITTSETFQVQPTLLLTRPVTNSFEVTASGKALIWLNRDVDADDLLAVNLGFGVGEDLTRWVIRPEVGVLFNPGQGGAFWQFSLGFTYYDER